MKINIIIYSVTLAVIFGACKTEKIAIEYNNKALPQTYTPASDTITTNLPDWKLIFFEPALQALIDSALLYNYDLQIAYQKIQNAKSHVRFNKGIRMPEVGISTSAGVTRYGEYTMDGVGNYDTRFSPNLNEKQKVPNPLPGYYTGFQTSWEIDFWGKLKNKKKAATARLIASQHGKHIVTTTLIAHIATTYYELLALDNEMKILQENIVLQQEALDMVIAQKQSAKANELAVEMLNSQLLNSKSIFAEVKQQLIECESKLNFLCGTYPQKIIRDTSSLSQLSHVTLSTGVPSSLLKNRPDILQAEMELIASNADVKSAQAAFYPNLTIHSSIGLQSFNALLLLESPASLAYNLLGNLSAPIINRRQIKSGLMHAKADQKKAYIEYEKTVVGGFMEVYIAIHKINNTSEMYQYKSEQVQILKQSITTSGELFKAGRAGYYEIIMAQQTALQSQLELNNYNKYRKIAIVELYKALGGGWK